MFSLLFSTGCPGPAPEPNKKDLLSKVWKVKEVLINGTPDLATNYSAHRFEFKTDNSYRFVYPTDSDQGTWELDSNEQNVIFDKGANDQQIGRIVVLNEAAFEFEVILPANYKNGPQTIVFKLIQ
jgi:hypothetical protein